MKVKTERAETLTSGKGEILDKQIINLPHKLACLFSSRFYSLLSFVETLPIRVFLLCAGSSARKHCELFCRWVQGGRSHLSTRTVQPLINLPLISHIVRSLSSVEWILGAALLIVQHSISNKAIEAVAVCHADIMKAKNDLCQVRSDYI